MQETDRQIEVVHKTSNRSFGIVMTVFFGAVGLLPLLKNTEPKYWAVVISGLFLLATAVVPKLLTPLNKFWFKLGVVLHKVMSPLILGTMFYLILTPMALILRMLKWDALRIRKSTATSHWILRTPPGPAPESLNNQF